MRKITLYLLSFCIMLASCVSGPKVETLFVGEGIMQYFIYPATLKSENSKVSIDVTYRKIKQKEGFVTVNFSYFYKDLIFSELKAAGFIHNDKYYPVSETTILYQEKRNHHIRYTSKIKENDFLEILKTWKSLSFFIETDVNKSIYPATTELIDKLTELSLEVF